MVAAIAGDHDILVHLYGRKHSISQHERVISASLARLFPMPPSGHPTPNTQPSNTSASVCRSSGRSQLPAGTKTVSSASTLAPPRSSHTAQLRGS